MNNFTHYLPTRIQFGKGQISHLSELAESGKRVLLVYGGGSIKKMGIYDEAVKLLRDAGLTIYELPGIEPNPKVETVRAGIALCREHSIDMVLAIGGGSVMDAAKAIAAGAVYDGDVWELVLDSSKIKGALPIYTVLTIAATGSEMDQHAVISDMTLNIKQAMHSDFIKPKMSICDPTYTFSVSKRQTAAGTADMMSHALENYFTNVSGGYLQARFGEALLRTCIHYGPIALEQPENYEARANLMWCSTNAINGIARDGAEVAWCVHPMEHELSAFYDITHGEGLAILTPRWMEHVLSDKTAAKFAEYGRNVWDLPTDEDDMTVAKKAIAKTAEFFFDVLHTPKTLTEVGIDDKNFERMAEKASAVCGSSFVPLSKDDVMAIFRRSL